jgi:hypothetical protein
LAIIRRVSAIGEAARLVGGTLMTLTVAAGAAHTKVPTMHSVPDSNVDSYFSADVETDGPIPGPYSMLSFALVYAGSFDGRKFERPEQYKSTFYRELRPISEKFEVEALRVNGLDREHLRVSGENPQDAMISASQWIANIAGTTKPVLVAFPLSFDWTWLYWYFVNFCPNGSPFGYSQCFDIKTALAVKSKQPIAVSGRSRIERQLSATHRHTHHAIDDAIAQAEIFANIFEWSGAE